VSMTVRTLDRAETEWPRPPTLLSHPVLSGRVEMKTADPWAGKGRLSGRLRSKRPTLLALRNGVGHLEIRHVRHFSRDIKPVPGESVAETVARATGIGARELKDLFC
jgi:hypothetical protein